MEQEDRAFIQEQFITGEIRWICATNAFGMGIHKNDIRQVIHEHFPPQSLDIFKKLGVRVGMVNYQLQHYFIHQMMKEEHVLSFKKICRMRKKFDTTDGLIAGEISSDEAATMAGLSETGKRVIDYYLERMSVDETINRLKEIAEEKETQLQQMLQLIHSEICIREGILSFFGEAIRDGQPLVVPFVV